ncbi:hypothetical protein [Paracoccus mutanolyticus]|uniref:hypothetical protein n=1 Tax=Paracoccus mutanolyticus TaxID=1499308 RepID=UPI00167BFA23|nr:hypothetical protein [Paracoccus mutanolyticus]
MPGYHGGAVATALLGLVLLPLLGWRSMFWAGGRSRLAPTCRAAVDLDRASLCGAVRMLAPPRRRGVRPR